MALTKSNLNRAAAFVVITGGAAALAVGLHRWQHRQKRERVVARQKSFAARAAKQVAEVGREGVEVLSIAHEKEATELMTRSFSGADPSKAPELGCEWKSGPEHRKYEDPERTDQERFGMTWCFRWCSRHGGVPIGVRQANGRLGAVCLAYPFFGAGGGHRGPTTYPHEHGGMADLGAPPFYRHAEGEAYLPRRRAQWFHDGPHNLLSKVHKAYAPEDHWYIQIMAVDPAAQGAGLARRALQTVLSLADRDGIIAYLETVGERNRQIYEKVGFKTAGGRGFELNMPGDPHPLNDPDLPSGIVRLYVMVYTPNAKAS